ncbi:hypothetical protein P3T37_006322 [Kitasatospora sp. MAA4]|uniref:hypothetical protein n=1 Tax=Kitasatospora sp. MAA4 TaxID=3035093 RepID=UPI0024771FB1|nr:hypothetical protein [Kitasatospora sp. MAA4]MDH6136891.1 hypothetical protein [Kitasatospora sp. MAA4]
MGVVIPIFLFLCLVGLILSAPRIEGWRAGHRCRQAAAELVATHGFTAEPQAGPSLVPWSAPPFHYGQRVRVRDAVRGSFDGLAATVFGYTCQENGTAHWYGVAVIQLPGRLSPIEVHHERVFSSVRVGYAPSYSPCPTGEPAFDSAHRVSSPDEGLAHTLLTPQAARSLLAAPEPFDWRVAEETLVVWRRDGWTSGAAAAGCCLAVVQVLAPALDLEPAIVSDPLRDAPGPSRRAE